MTRPLSYPEIDYMHQLRNSGRELLGKHLYATEKRDGENCMFWLDEDKQLHISSRNMDEAARDIQARVKSTKEYPKVVELLQDHPEYIVFVESLKAGYGPTKIEKPPLKYPRLILIDIYDKQFALEGGRYLAYPALYQVAYHYKLPIVRLVDEATINTMEELKPWLESFLTWGKRHKREGVVVKGFDGLDKIFFKVKIDYPTPVKEVHKRENVPQYPSIPDSEVMGAISKVEADYGREFLLDKSKGMPKVVEYVNAECKKHLFAMPKNIFSYYQRYLNNNVSNDSTST